MTTRAGKFAPFPQRIFLSTHRMARRPEAPHNMYAIPDVRPGVARYAEIMYGLRKLKRSISRVRVVAMGAHT